jgi:hypothetical protein
MNKLLTFVVSLFIFFLMSNCTTTKNYLLSTPSKVELPSAINPNLISYIKNNVFYSKKDSIYIINFDAFSKIYNDYYFDFQKLNKKEFSLVLGKPHLDDSVGLGYILGKWSFPDAPQSVSIQYFTFTNEKFNGIFAKDIKRNPDVEKRIKEIAKSNEKNRTAKGIIPCKIILSNSNTSQLCNFVKQDFQKHFYFNKNSKTYIFSSNYTLIPISRINNCDNTFLRDEIISLLGNPNYETNTEMYYKITNDTFQQKIDGQNTTNNGKIQCINFFKEPDTNSYQFTIKYQNIK